MFSSKSMCAMSLVGALAFSVGNAEAALLAHLEFEGNLLDTATGNFDGTVAGAGLGGFVAGETGQAVQFDGSATRIDLPGTPAAMSEFTIAFFINSPDWFNALTVPVANVGWSGGVDDFVFQTLPDNNAQDIFVNLPLNGWVLSNNGTFTAPSYVNRWVHMAVTYNVGDGTRKLYVDGVEQFNSGPAAGAVAFDNGITLGAWDFAGDGTGFDRANTLKMDDFRLYDNALTASEVLALVPEPASLGLLTVGGLLLSLRRKA